MLSLHVSNIFFNRGDKLKKELTGWLMLDGELSLSLIVPNAKEHDKIREFLPSYHDAFILLWFLFIPHGNNADSPSQNTSR